MGHMRSEPAKSVADVEGPWVDPGFASGLIERCRRGWDVPVGELSNEVLATYLRQGIGLAVVVAEARRRVGEGVEDGAEMYEGSWGTEGVERVRTLGTF